MNPLRVAVVGCGQMARCHVGALRRVAVPHRIVGVFDPIPEQAADFAKWCSAPSYTSVAALLQEARPEIVHVCTPPSTHTDVARLALDSGAHVYIEKPFAETLADARELIALSRSKGVILCAGHQLLCDPVFSRLNALASVVGPATHVESVFLFQPAGMRPALASPGALAAALLDILPHPLYLLVAALEHAGVQPGQVTIASAVAGPADVEAVLHGPGDQVWGRLWVSLRARPVTSSLSYIGAGGTVTADFVRGSIGGVPNPGTSPFEKLGNAALEGAARAWHGSIGLARRLLGGRDYPGLPQLLEHFYKAVERNRPGPISTEHLRNVTALYEELAARVHASINRGDAEPGLERDAPIAVVTGAGGMLGRAVAQALADRGYRVRGIGRSANPHDPHIHEWYRLDLSRADAAAALTGADIVIHAAAATSGGFDSHQRHTIDATRRLLSSMAQAGVKRLVYVSSLSVLEPPSSMERQDETTPLARDARRLGPYTWGKREAEHAVATEAPGLGVLTRIVRPGALVAWVDPDLPGLVGRRLFGRWHLGLGRSSLPIGVYPVHETAQVIASMAARFNQAPPVVNLVDGTVPTRAALLIRLKAAGWQGRMIWVPISLVAAGITAVRLLLGIARGALPEPLDSWAVLRPRRFDTSLASKALRQAERPDAPAGVKAAV